jgi:hypothetical protein
VIKIKGNKAIFTGRDAIQLKRLAKLYGLSVQTCFKGMMWEYFMKCAREGMFKK